jgi:hypothetical protein
MRETRESVSKVLLKHATENGKEGVLKEEFLPSAAGKTGYFNGDAVRFTGKIDILYGGVFYEAVFTEGHRQGETVSVADRIAKLYLS